MGRLFRCWNTGRKLPVANFKAAGHPLVRNCFRSMPDALVIRRYQPSDHPQVMELHIRPMQQVGAYKGDGPWDDDLKQIEAEYSHDFGDFLVGERDHRIVAMGALRKTGDRQGEIRRVRVHPDYQRRGYGRQVMEALEARARELDYHTIQLQTQEIQEAARKFYRQLGYREVRKKVQDQRDYIVFEKKLRKAP